MARKKPAKTIDTAQMVVDAFKSSWNYRENSYHSQWQNWYKLYNSERVLVGYNGITDTFVPMSYGIIESLVSATSGEKPYVEYIPTKFEQEQATEVLNSLYAYYWDLDNWTNKEIQHTRNFFLYGASVKYLYWNIDHPCVELIPLRDFYCDPTATIYSYQSARFMGHRFLTTLEALKEEKMVDPESGELVDKYKNLNDISGTSGTSDMTDKEQKDQWMGSTLTGDERQQQVEVLCHWTLDKVYYVANRKTVIYEEDNYFKQRQQFLGFPNPTGMYPYIVDANDPDESQLYGRSSLQPVLKPQELLNDITNQNTDAVSFVLDPTMELDPMYSSYIDKIKNVTGAVYPFKPGSYKAVDKPLVPSNAFNERVNIKNEIREATAIDQIIRGVTSTGDTTATEIKAQVASAGRRFDMVISQLENGGYYTQAKLVFQMVQLYVTLPVMFRVVGQNGIDWQTFDPAIFKGDYEPRVKLKATLEGEKRKKIRDVKEMYSALLGSPFVNQAQLAKYVLQKGFDLSREEVQPLAVSEQAAAGGSKDNDGDPKELINYKDAPSDIQAQMEEAAGYTPSVTHQDAMDTTDLQNAAEQAKALGTIAPEGMAPPGLGVEPQAVGVADEA